MKHNTAGCLFIWYYLDSGPCLGPRSGVRRNDEYPLRGEEAADQNVVDAFLPPQKILAILEDDEAPTSIVLNNLPLGRHNWLCWASGLQKNSNHELSVTQTKYFMVVQPGFSASNGLAQQRSKATSF